ncbi:MAG: 50S ribosomal protein L17 [Streptosporangiales bacterium]
MPTPSRGPRLGGSPNHERLILSNLAAQLFEHGRITTTVPKAKRLRPLAERLITKARRGDVHARRQVAKVIRDRSVAHSLFAEIAPRYVNRPGGYTRITRIGARKGDNAPLAVIELVEELEQRRTPGRQAPAKKAAKKATKAAEPAPEAAAVEATASEDEAEESAAAEENAAEPAAEETEVAEATEDGEPRDKE